MNTYSVPLTAQELRNGRYFGYFKQTAYRLAREQIEFWRQNKIMTERGIARMAEAELTSELMILQIDGLQDKKNTINKFYADLDDDFPNREEVASRFLATMNIISETFGTSLSETNFRRVPLFYSLFGAVYHRRFGVPKVELDTPKKPFSEAERKNLRNAIDTLSNVLELAREDEPVPKRYVAFVNASRRRPTTSSRAGHVWRRSTELRFDAMPREMPALSSQFADAAATALALAEAGELVRQGAPRGSVAFRELKPSRLEALHEMAFLRVFVEWENFLEASFLRTLCGYVSPLYTPAFTPGSARQPTLAAAELALLAGNQYLLWHNPVTTVSRAKKWFIGAPHELVILSNLARLEWFAWVRHAVAHRSDDSKRKLDLATGNLAGRRYAGSSAGRFLRDWDPQSHPQTRWLHSITAELVALSGQICPN